MRRLAKYSTCSVTCFAFDNLREVFGEDMWYPHVAISPMSSAPGGIKGSRKRVLHSLWEVSCEGEGEGGGRVVSEGC